MTPYEYQLANWYAMQEQRAQAMALQEQQRAQREQQARADALYAEAQGRQDEARQANESRYLDILEGHTGTRDRVLADVNQWGGSLIEDTNRLYDVGLRSDLADLAGRGLANSTVRTGIKNRNREERGRALNRLNDTILENRIGADERLSNNLYNFMERRNDVYPDLNQFVEMSRLMGSAAGGMGPTPGRQVGGSMGNPVGNPPPGGSRRFGGQMPPNSMWKNGKLVPIPPTGPHAPIAIATGGRPGFGAAAPLYPMPRPPAAAARRLGPNLNDPANYAAVNSPARLAQNAQNLYMNYRGASPRPDIAGLEAQGITGTAGMYQVPQVPGSIQGLLGSPMPEGGFTPIPVPFVPQGYSEYGQQQYIPQPMGANNRARGRQLQFNPRAGTQGMMPYNYDTVIV